MAPFAGFESFDSCCKIQMNKHKGEKGFSMDNARRICGAIQAKVEGTKK